jgi:hypothetical protein
MTRSAPLVVFDHRESGGLRTLLLPRALGRIDNGDPRSGEIRQQTTCDLLYAEVVSTFLRESRAMQKVVTMPLIRGLLLSRRAVPSVTRGSRAALTVM